MWAALCCSVLLMGQAGAGAEEAPPLPELPALLPADSEPPAADAQAETQPLPAPPEESAAPTPPPNEAPPPPVAAPPPPNEAPPALVTPPPAAPRASPPRPRWEPAPLWKSVVAAGVTTTLVVGGANALAGLVGTGALLGFLVAAVPASLEASPLVCLGGVCGVLPAQGLMFAVVALVTPVVAAPLVAWAIKRFGVRTMDPIPLFASMTVPSLLAFVVAGLVQVVGAFGNCFILWVSLALVMDWLMSAQGWPQQNAEYWAMRRVAPVAFYGVILGTQLVALLALVGGTAMSAALGSLAAAWLAEPIRPKRRARVRPRAEVESVAPPVTVVQAAPDAVEALE